MPGMDGITLLKRLKQEKISIQSLVLSCFDEFELVREAMKYGAHDYIRKLSIDPAKLLEVLKEMKEAISDQPEKNASFFFKYRRSEISFYSSAFKIRGLRIMSRWRMYSITSNWIFPFRIIT